ncbi:MAG TPA: class A beta-lactamase [Bryobacteraceae bacterium]
MSPREERLSRRGCLVALGGATYAAATGDLVSEWRRIALLTDGTVGAAALNLDSGRSASMNGDKRFPLASVCKLPIAMNILGLVDEGRLARNERIEILVRDVVSSVSPIAQRWPTQRSFPLDEMLELMVANSDNTAVETLFRIGGEASAMEARFRQWTIARIRVDRSERQCGLDRSGVKNYPPPAEWTDAVVTKLIEQTPLAVRYQATLRYLADPRDTGTPTATVQLLAGLFRGKLISQGSSARLIEILQSTSTFSTRLKGDLPPGTVVAHKTGSTNTINGLTAATNDSGVIFRPDGSRVAVSVYVKASTRSDAVRDSVIARIARAAYELA